jgi:murein DD-endopeptidase MepM/ murein hydrolase activator NlpD
LQYSRNRARVGPRLSALPIILLLLLAAALAAVLYVAVRMMTAPRPVITLARPFDMVGRNSVLSLDVRDRTGLRSVKVTVRQGDKEQTVVDETFQPPRPQAHEEWRPARETRFRLTEGPGTVRVEARNASWGGFFKGRTASFEKTFTARLTPPRIEVLTTQHYVNQGGCDMVVYRVTPPGAESGVEAGNAWFPGFPMPGASDPAIHFALFAYPYDAAAGTTIRLKARDEASNEVLAGFNLKVFPRTFRTRALDISESFLQKVVPEILSQSPAVQDQGDLLKSFLVINRDLRKMNNKALADLARRSQPRRLWKEPFRQLGNSQVEASFADHRTYMYQGREVDRQDHLGYDLATTAHAPVSASNDGVVLLAEYFGIYGNTIVIDHGYGLLTVYGHLASFAVKAGDKVERGQLIAQSDSTGLAGGDHLHFSVVLQGQQVDAREWWDPHWIEDRIMTKLREFGQGAAPAPASTPATPPPTRHSHPPAAARRRR